MVSFIKIGSILGLLAVSTLPLLAKPAKLYDEASGVIEYSVEGDGARMNITHSTKGVKVLSFKESGNQAITEENYTITTNGKAEKKQMLAKYDNGTVYSVDFKEKYIMKMDMNEIMQSSSGKSSLTQGNKEMMQQMGGKVTGTDSVLGYKCEKWEFQWGSVCTYKGIPLKTLTNMMGMTHNEVATKIQFDVTPPASKFVLPNYPIRSMNEVITNNIQKQNNMKTMSDEDKKELEELMKAMNGGPLGK